MLGAMAGRRPPPQRHHLPELHRGERAGWLRAAVLGANDGIVSVSALLVGVLGSDATFGAVRAAGIAGLVAGALSMAAGEYVSVSAQRDVEQADLRTERKELAEQPAAELAELAGIWRSRGLSPELAQQVAEALTEVDPLVAHARDELGLTELSTARPLQAAAASAAAFVVGALVPFVALLVAPEAVRTAVVMVVTVLALAGSGALGASAGGAPLVRAAGRVVLGGLLAMVVTLGIGELAGATLG